MREVRSWGREAGTRRSRAIRPAVEGSALEPRVVLSGFAADGPPVAVASVPALGYGGAEQTLATWMTNASGGTRNITAKRFDLTGAPVGGEIHIATSGTSTTPAVGAINANGQTVVAWTVPVASNAVLPGASTAVEVHAQLFSPTGLALSPDLTLGKADGLKAPVVAIANTGDFVVGFTQVDTSDPSAAQSPVARTYRYSTSVLSDPISLEAAMPGSTYEMKAVGLDDLGRFVAAWTRNTTVVTTDPTATASTSTAPPSGAVVARFDLAGRALGNPEVLTTKASGGQGSVTFMSLAVDPTGKFAIGYQDAGGADADYISRRYNASGVFAGQTMLSLRIGSAGITTLVNGRAIPSKLAPGRTEIVTWIEVNAAGDFVTLAMQGDPLKNGTQVIRTYSSSGQPTGSLSTPYSVSKYASVDPSGPTVGASATLLADGRVVLLQGERSTPLAAVGYTAEDPSATVALQTRVELPALPAGATPTETTTTTTTTSAPTPTTPAARRAAMRQAKIAAAVKAAQARAQLRAAKAAKAAAARRGR